MNDFELTVPNLYHQHSSDHFDYDVIILTC